jgi:sucrose phosphorylase
MVLEAFFEKSSARLARYLRHRPPRQFTMLDCHDGVPVKPDLDGLVSTADARKLVDTCLARGANLSLIFSPKHRDPDGFDVHQIRCSYYSMLEADDDAYLAARAIQFFTPGVPQVYYVGLLAGENDVEAVERTGEGREINRHNYTVEEIEQAVQQDVVQRLVRLIRFRNAHPAFDGDFTVGKSDARTLILSWRNGAHACTLTVDLEAGRAEIAHTGEGGARQTVEV